MHAMSSDVWFSTFPPSCGSAPPPQQCLLAAAAGSFCRITRNDLLGCELWLDNSEQHLWASSLNVPRMSQPAQPNEWHNAWIWWTNFFFLFPDASVAYWYFKNTRLSTYLLIEPTEIQSTRSVLPPGGHFLLTPAMLLSHYLHMLIIQAWRLQAVLQPLSALDSSPRTTCHITTTAKSANSPSPVFPLKIMIGIRSLFLHVVVI